MTDEERAGEPILCPSARCEEGSIFLGIVLGDGRMVYASDRIILDQEFVQIAHEGRPPEKRFRFASPCVKGTCRQWTGSSCGVIETVIEKLASFPSCGELPTCSIRSRCRWFRQRGAAACAVCPEVITDLEES
jgi:hypothetical protein